MTGRPQVSRRVRRGMSLFRYVLLTVWMLLLLPASAWAESLAGVRQSTLPAPPAPVHALRTAGGNLLAFSDTAVLTWSPAASRWQPLVLPAGAKAGDGWQNAAIDRLYRVPAAGDGASTTLEAVEVAGNRLSLRRLPELPVALHHIRLAEQAGFLYAAGIDGTERPHLLRRTLSQPTSAWQVMTPWPGTTPASTLVAQRGELIVTTPAQPGDALWRWSSDTGWQSLDPVPGRVVASEGARATGQAHVLYMLQPREGETPRLATFHTITRAWADLPAMEGAIPATLTAWGTGFASASTGSSTLGTVELTAQTYLLKWLDWLVIVVYLAAMVGIGLYFYLQEKRASTADFFVGGRSIPFWAAGVSLYATNTSSISFIAIPAKAFETNWQYLTNNLIAVLGLVFVAIWIVPLLRRLDLMSVFSYLEKRFHPAIRMLASALCIAMQIGSRMSVILFLPALAIATITGLDVVWSILIMGVFTIIYTTLGGMKAVIWTDFVQVFVMFGGAIFAIGFIIYHLNGGVPEFLQVAMAENKTQLFDFSFDLTKATVWGFIFLVVFDVVLTFPKDQVLMQRVLSTKSDKEAGRSIWTFAAIMIPGGFFFYAIGTALYVYYQSHPERMNPLLPIDATFPLFIAAELPAGVTGLIIAGIFAAAMSTLSSIINSVSTLASVDFYEKLAKNPTPKKSVLFAEIMGVLVGLAGIAIALVLSRYDIHSLFDVSIELAGLLGGGFAGAYTLGMFTRRANSQGVAIGIGSSIVLTLVIWSMDLVHPYFYLAISILLCIVIGYAASWLFPAPTRSLQGLTIHRQDAVGATD